MGYLLSRVESFARFQGENLTAGPVMGYAKAGRVPHEIHNFSVASDGFIYGYLPKGGGGDLSRLEGERNAEEVSNVTVIFISDGVLCGYYRNATVFANQFRHPDGLMAGEEDIYCRVKVDPNQAFLIPFDKRNWKMQTQPTSSFPVMYGDKNADWIDWFERFFEDSKISIESEKKRLKWTQGVERKSKARKMAINAYGLTCECCKVAHDDNVRASIFEVHHKVPYAEDFKDRVLKVSDLAVLCANCHRMIHKMPDVANVKSLAVYLGLI